MVDITQIIDFTRISGHFWIAVSFCQNAALLYAEKYLLKGINSKTYYYYSHE